VKERVRRRKGRVEFLPCCFLATAVSAGFTVLAFSRYATIFYLFIFIKISIKSLGSPGMLI
jgi:hypothetical protein